MHGASQLTNYYTKVKTTHDLQERGVFFGLNVLNFLALLQFTYLHPIAVRVKSKSIDCARCHRSRGALVSGLAPAAVLVAGNVSPPLLVTLGAEIRRTLEPSVSNIGLVHNRVIVRILV